MSSPGSTTSSPRQISREHLKLSSRPGSTLTRPSDADALAIAANSGDDRALGRLISLVESDPAALAEVSPRLAANASRAHTIGVTGSPGVGKSTLIAELIRQYRAGQQRVAVVAVDPSSPFSGGALLGDRIRMQAHVLDRDVFIRSMSNHGHLGGLASRTPDVIDLVSRARFDVVMIETVGIGQAEVEIANYADTVVLVSTADSGDSVQVAKAGVLEIGDVFVVNKSDRPGSSAIAGDLREMLSLGAHEGGFDPQVLELSAQSHQGVAELIGEITRHREWLSSSGELEQLRVRRAETRLRSVLAELALARTDRLDDGAAIHTAAAQIAEGSLDVRGAAQALLDRVTSPRLSH
jgi:LAO/AO transport system kinase